jgi:YVTN family beta-propeller protein
MLEHTAAMIMKKGSCSKAIVGVALFLFISIILIYVSVPVGADARSNNTSPYAIICSSAPGGGFTQNFGISIINLTSTEVDALYGGQSPAWGVAASPDGQYLYLISEMGNKMTIMDARNMTVKGIMDVGLYPQDVVVSPDGSTVYVSSEKTYIGDNLYVLSVASGTVVSTINTNISIGKMALSPDGSRLYAAQSFHGTYEASTDILVVDTANNTVCGTFKTGMHPVSVAVSPDGSRLYAACMGTGIVTSIDTTTGKTMAMATTGRAPVDIALSPDGSTLYAVNDYYGRSFVSAINITDMSIQGKVDLPGHPVDEYRSSYIKRIIVNDSMLYVSDYTSGAIYAVNATAGAIAATVKVGNSPSGMALSHDRLYVTSKGSGGLAVINTTSFEASTVSYAMSPRYVSILPGGRKAYITNGDIGTVTVLSVDTMSIATTIDAGGIMNRLTASPEGGLVYVADTGNDRIVRIDTSSDRVVGNWSLGRTPTDVATSPDGSLVYVIHDRKAGDASDDDLSIIDAATGTVLSTRPLGKYTGSLAVTPDGKKLYVCLWESDTVLVIDPSTGRITSRITAPGSPEDVIVSPDGRLVYVACPNGAGVSVYFTEGDTYIASIAGSAHPHHIAITPDGTTLCASGRGGVVLIDLKNWSVIKELPVSDTMGVAINPAMGGIR